MVNKAELEICKRRGHDAIRSTPGWGQCKWCGMWRRLVPREEEREDDPPMKERDIFEQMKSLKGLNNAL